MELTVRPLYETDLEQIMHWRMQPDITRYMNSDPVLTLEMQKTWFDRMKSNPSVRYFMIVVDGQEAGVINLADIDYEKGEASWGYYVAVKECRSFELAVTLEWNLYEYALIELGLQYLYCESFCENKGVVNLHRFCGSAEKTVLQNHVVKNGRSYDVSVAGITAEEWMKKREELEFRRVQF